MIALLTIMHTGTRFVRSSILNDFDFFHLQQEIHQRSVNPGWFGHIYPENYPDIEDRVLGHSDIVVPLRHPARVRLSWERRKRNIDRLELCWDYLIDVISKHDPVYIPIDSESREYKLSQASERLGVTLSTDWGVVCSEVGTSDIEITDEMKSKVRGKVMDFYYEYAN